jgi:hypothetical protein
VGSDTLLGPEETDRLGGRHRWVMASGFARWSLVKTVGAVCPRLRDRPSVTSAHIFGCGCLVMGLAWSLFVV